MKKLVGIVGLICCVMLVVIFSANLILAVLGGQAWYNSAWEFASLMSAPPIWVLYVSCIYGLVMSGLGIWIFSEILS